MAARNVYSILYGQEVIPLIDPIGEYSVKHAGRDCPLNRLVAYSGCRFIAFEQKSSDENANVSCYLSIHFVFHETFHCKQGRKRGTRQTLRDIKFSFQGENFLKRCSGDRGS